MLVLMDFTVFQNLSVSRCTYKRKLLSLTEIQKILYRMLKGISMINHSEHYKENKIVGHFFKILQSIRVIL